MSEDIRWKQRYANFRLALAALSRAVALASQRPLSELEQQGLIQGFEYTHELAWNVLKDYLEAQGILELIGSRNAVREAFRNGLIDDGEVWMAMIRDRNLTSHMYNTALAGETIQRILGQYHAAFIAMEKRFEAIAQTVEQSS